MRKNVVVTYTLRPEARAEHVRLIEGVFAQLRAEGTGVDYQVLCLADGVSFVHVASFDSADGANPLTGLTTFREFNRDIAARVATAPAPSEATVIGGHHGLDGAGLARRLSG
jgi:hypothetical protein